MTTQEIENLIKSIASALDVDYIYSHFSDKIKREKFLCWYYTDNDDFFAEDSNYVDIAGITIEYYSSQKKLAEEKTIESILKQKNITYEKNNLYIYDEKIYLVSYYMEEIIDE